MAPHAPGEGSRGIPLEHVLGPARDRYFAAGYRGVRHTVDVVDAATDTRHAEGRVDYPARWSVGDGGHTRTAHLSSVDAIVLPLLVWQHTDADRAAHDIVRSVALRAGNTPWTALDRVPIQTTRASDGADVTLTSTVGNIRSTITLTPCRTPGRAARALETSPRLVYGDLYRLIESQSALTHFDPVDRVIGSAHRAEAPSLAVDGVSGIEGAFWPALTAIDYLVTMGQLTQAVIFEVSRSTRSMIDNLWMRTLHIALPETPTALPAQYRAATRLIRDTTLNIGGRHVHDVRVESTASTGVVAGATLAYTEVSA